MAVEGTCSSGAGFLRRGCGRESAGLCVYCAAPFCTDHGSLNADYYQVCNRKPCLAKFADIAAHQRWLDAHQSPTRMSMCAEDGCQERMQHSCQRCWLRFCDTHLIDKAVTEFRLEGRVRTVQLMCPHCAERRVLWD